MCKAPLWHVVCLSHICRSNEVLRRTYGKDDRVLHTAKLSQGSKVVPPSRTWQGAGISTGGTKIGVTGSETRTADIMIGGAILPSLLHQDARYFYQGTGTTGSRFRHAVFSTFVARTDKGGSQPNYSSLGGVLASSSLANLYYPRSNRGAGLVFGNFAIGIAERIGANVAQEFLLGKFTRRGGHLKGNE